MKSADEVTADVATPPPQDTAVFAAGGTAPSLPVPPRRPTPAEVLGWVAAAAGPWFPSAHAARTGADRGGLDEPLNELRAAGLVAVADWVRGAGQGYVLTPDGESAARAAAADRAAGGDPADGGIDDLPLPPTPAAPRPPTPLVTPALVLANVLWFFVGLVLASRAGVPVRSYLWDGPPAVLARLGAVSGPDLVGGEWWRLATCCFVHVGLVHLLVNMVVLVLIGPWAELLWGRWRLAVIYAASGVAGSALAMAIHPVHDGGGLAMPAGASGAILGVLASLVAWVLIFRSYLPAALVAERSRRLAVLSALAVGSSLVPGVNWQAHLGGAAAGFVVAGLLNATRFGNRPRRVAAVLLLAAAPVAAAAGLGWAMRAGNAWAPLRQQAAAADHARQVAADADRLKAAAATFAREVLPLLAPIRPEAVKPVEDRAARLLTVGLTGGKAGAEVRAAAEQLRAAADAAAAGLAGPPAGDEPFDRLREKGRAYAAARAASLATLAGLLDAGTAPPPAVLKAWLDGRREADRLWPGVGRP